MDYVDPIDEFQKNRVSREVEKYFLLAEAYYGRTFERIPVRFNLKGRSSGMFRVKQGEAEFRFNPWIFAVYFQQCLESTVPHEVAHYISHSLFDLTRIKPHGKEWREVMAVFRAEPSVTSSFSLDGVPIRASRYVDYRCSCREHRLGIRRHNKILRGQARYSCLQCGDFLQVAS